MGELLNYRTYESLYYAEKAGVPSAKEELKIRAENKRILPLLQKGGNPFFYVMSPGIESCLLELERLYNLVDIKNTSVEVEKEVFNSCVIEGAKTTLADTIRISKEQARPKDKSQKMVYNTLKAVRYLKGLKETVSEDQLIEVWNLIIRNVCENEEIMGEKYRKGTVYVGSPSEIVYTAPDAGEIQGMMNRLFVFMNEEQMHPFIQAIVLHFYFVYIHPFCDGNGRTARLMHNDYLIKHGYEKFKAMSLTTEVGKNINGYYKAIKDSEENQGDITFFIVFYLNIMTDLLEKAAAGFQPYRDFYKDLNESQNKIAQLLRKKQNNMLTKDKCADILNISVEDAEMMLEDMVSKGILKKKQEEQIFYKWNEYRW